MAIEELKSLVFFLSMKNQETAEKFAHAVIDAARYPLTMSDRGRMVPEFDDEMTRELIYPPYRVVYRINFDQNSILISRFWSTEGGRVRM